MNALTQKPISPANIPVNAHTGANVLRGSTSATAQSALAAVVLMLLGSQAHASPASILCAQMGNLHGLACLGAQRSDDSASMSSGAPAPTLAGTTTWPVPAAMPAPPPPPAPPAPPLPTRGSACLDSPVWAFDVNSQRWDWYGFGGTGGWWFHWGNPFWVWNSPGLIWGWRLNGVGFCPPPPPDVSGGA